jgi:hypothetical protein
MYKRSGETSTASTRRAASGSAAALQGVRCAGVFVLAGLVGLLALSCRTTRSLEEVEAALGTLEASAADEDLEQTEVERGLRRMEALYIVLGEDLASGRVDADASAPQPSVVAPVELVAGECIAVWAFSEHADMDLDVEIANAGGYVDREEVGTDGMPVIPQFCALAAGTHEVRFRLLRGAGAFAWAVRRWPDAWQAAQGRMDRAWARWMGDEAPLIRRWPLQRALLTPSTSLDTTIALVPGCFSAIATGGAGVVDLDLEWADVYGEPMFRDFGTDGEPIVGPLCVTSPTAARLRIRMYQGSGEVWWQVLHTGPVEGEGSG